MAFDRIDPILLATDSGARRPELLLSAVLHLMSHYSTARGADSGACLKLAAVIERHLKALSSLPDLAPVLQATCMQLSEQWAQMVEQALPQPRKSSFLSRIISGAKAGTALADGKPSHV